MPSQTNGAAFPPVKGRPPLAELDFTVVEVTLAAVTGDSIVDVVDATMVLGETVVGG
jgi:hypothetical protein